MPGLLCGNIATADFLGLPQIRPSLSPSFPFSDPIEKIKGQEPLLTYISLHSPIAVTSCSSQNLQVSNKISPKALDKPLLTAYQNVCPPTEYWHQGP